MRYAVINADDFGYSEAVNEAIITCYQKGILTSTSLMVRGEKANTAIQFAQENPDLGVGLHLVLCCGKSALTPTEIPHLVDKNGNFSSSPEIAGLKYQFIPQAKEELRKEIKAQLQAFKNTGLQISHVDGHLHLHTHPLVLEILVELAEEFDYKFIRLPSEELYFTLSVDNNNLLLKVIYDAVFRQLRLYGEKLLNSSNNLNYLEKVYGLLETGKITESYLLGLIPQIEANYIEIYAHPQYLKQSLSSKIVPNSELEAFCSQKVKDMLSLQNFQLVNYLQLREKLK